jgi:pyruvate dehydrogenase E2 component (dihydrolipoamide acetyltransferase)
MASEVFMPRLTHDMTTGRLLRWFKREGDFVNKGEPLFEVETDKAVSEVQAESSGILKGIADLKDQEVQVGAVMAFIVMEGEEISQLAATISPVIQPQPDRLSNEKSSSQPENRSITISEQHVLITPIARKLVKEHNIDIHQLKGSGPHGRILEADVLFWISRRENQTPVSFPFIGEDEYDEIPRTDIQRKTGERMLLSATSIPQFTLEVDVNMAEALRLREFIKTLLGLNISISSFLIAATARTLRFHPRLNGRFIGNQIRSYKSINLGVAMATSQGLLAPVIHNTDALTLAQIQGRLDAFKSQASGKSFSASDLSGGTFTISNLGMYGIDRFTGLINPPEIAILTIGQMRDHIILKADKPIPQPILTLRLSADHRVLDGATAAPFLVDLKKLIEDPQSIS